MLATATRSFTVIAAWQVTCAIAFVLFGYTIGWGVYSIYTGIFGDIQDSYMTYHRASTYSVIVVVTALATAVGVALLIVMEGRRATVRHTIGTFVAWHAAAVAALVVSEELGLFWVFHRIDWNLFGTPENLYSFRNLMLPRVIAWLMSSTAAIGMVLWLRDKLVPVETRPPAQPARSLRTASPPGKVFTDENPYAPPQSTQPPS